MKIITLLSVFLLALAWLLPNHYLPWLAAYNDGCIFLAVFLIATNVLYQKSIDIPRFSLFLIILAFIPIVQCLGGMIVFFGDAIISCFYLLLFFIAFITAFNLVKELKVSEKNKLFTSLCIIVLTVSIIFVWVQLRQWLLFDGNIWIVDLPPNARPFANFGQPNNCATFLIMGLMASLYCYEKKQINQCCGLLLASFILFGISLTQSRTAWVFTLAFLIWWFWKSRYFPTRLYRYSIFYFVAIFIFFILSMPYISSFLGVTSTADVMTRASTGYLRIPMWHQMLLAIKQQPLWGYGWNQVSVAQLSVYLDYPTTERIEHSHNIFLDLLLWNGMPLGLAIIGFFTWWLYRLSKLATSIESFIALSMVGAVLVHAMLEYPLEYAFFLLPIGFLLGLVQAEDQTIKVIQITRKESATFLIGCFILYTWILIEYRMIEKDAQLVRFESHNIGTLHAKSAAPDVILLTQLREQIRFMRTPPTKNMTQEQLNWMKHVVYRFATPAALHRYAQALALNHQPELAKKHLLILEKLYDKKVCFESLSQVSQSSAFEWQNQSESKS